MPVRKPVLTMVVVLAAVSMTLASCARQINPGVYEGSTVGSAVQTHTGTVQSARTVIVQEDEFLHENVMGGAIGAAAGGAAASRLGEGWGKTAAVAGGALAGATLGALGQRTLQRQQAMEYIVRLDNGQLMTVVQGLNPQIPVGRRVYVQTGVSGGARVLPAG